jgi:hypothetical protein
MQESLLGCEAIALEMGCQGMGMEQDIPERAYPHKPGPACGGGRRTRGSLHHRTQGALARCSRIRASLRLICCQRLHHRKAHA